MFVPIALPSASVYAVPLLRVLALYSHSSLKVPLALKMNHFLFGFVISEFSKNYFTTKINFCPVP